jgi:hypothetical protein
MCDANADTTSGCTIAETMEPPQSAERLSTRFTVWLLVPSCRYRFASADVSREQGHAPAASGTGDQAAGTTAGSYAPSAAPAVEAGAGTRPAAPAADCLRPPSRRTHARVVASPSPARPAALQLAASCGTSRWERRTPLPSNFVASQGSRQGYSIQCTAFKCGYLWHLRRHRQDRYLIDTGVQSPPLALCRRRLRPFSATPETRGLRTRAFLRPPLAAPERQGALCRLPPGRVRSLPPGGVSPRA